VYEQLLVTPPLAVRAQATTRTLPPEQIGSAEPNRLETTIPGGATTWQSKITVLLSPTVNGNTNITLEGKIGGAGPVQKQAIRRSVSLLKQAISDNFEGTFLRDCVLLGGHGHDIASGTRCTVLFRPDGAEVAPAGGESMSFRYEEIQALTIGGRGLIKSGGGFIGGGFGLEGAAVGMGVASLLNSLTAKSRIDTVINIKARERQVWLHYPHETPGALNIRLSGVVAKIESANPHDPSSTAGAAGSVSDELARIHELHSQGVLTDEEYTAAKGRLIERL
jgi:hypothetical protein